MRSSFSRMFIPGVLMMLVALGILGLSFQLINKRYLEEKSMERMQESAQTVADVAAAYYSEGYGSPEDFYVVLSVASRAAGADMVVCDAAGRLVLCTESPMGCSHQGMQITDGYLDQVKTKGAVSDRGVIRGLYSEPRFVTSVAIRDDAGRFMGIVVASIPTAESMQVLRAITNVFLIVALLVILAAVAFMSVLSGRTAHPLKEIARAANAFAHGDLSARVPEDMPMPEELQEVTLAFNNMAATLEKSEYQRQEFVANVSHELKTPMTTIAGFMDGILDGTIPAERQSYYMQLVSNETKRLNRLVRSMLDISRLQDQGGIREDQKTRFDILECAGQTLISFEQKILGKHLEVQVDMPEHPVFTRANQDYITQVIYNLLDNAVKFCPAGGRLSLKIREGNSKVYVSIANSGQTIPAQELPLVFDRFHKTDKSRSEDREGWGLGLYIVRTMILCHGEDISVTSAGGETEFTFTLPRVN